MNDKEEESSSSASSSTPSNYDYYYYSLPPLPTLPITSPETLQKCRSLSVDVNKNDSTTSSPRTSSTIANNLLPTIFIASFPKSGTTWMQNIVLQLILATKKKKDENGDDDDDDDGDDMDNSNIVNKNMRHISEYAPFYEIDAHWTEDGTLLPRFQKAHQKLGYRIYNTHLRWDMLPKSSSNGSSSSSSSSNNDGQHNHVKYIYVVRDGRDVMTSFYHHLSNQHVDDGGFQGTFQEFFDQFLEGTVAYGKWSHHLASWMPEIMHCQNPQILLVPYEQLQSDLRGQLLRLAEFLELLPPTTTTTTTTTDQSSSSFWLEQVLERVSFDYMRKNQDLFHPISVRWKPGYHFIRSGTVGDYQSLFTKEHQERFLALVKLDFQKLLLLRQEKKKKKKKSSGDSDYDGCDEENENKNENEDSMMQEDEDGVPKWLYAYGFVKNNSTS